MKKDELTDEKKAEIIGTIKHNFGVVREMLDQVEDALTSADLRKQAANVWIGDQFCRWYEDFVKALKDMENQVVQVEKEMRDADIIEPTIEDAAKIITKAH